MVICLKCCFASMLIPSRVWATVVGSLLLCAQAFVGKMAFTHAELPIVQVLMRQVGSQAMAQPSFQCCETGGRAAGGQRVDMPVVSCRRIMVKYSDVNLNRHRPWLLTSSHPG